MLFFVSLLGPFHTWLCAELDREQRVSGPFVFYILTLCRERRLDKQVSKGQRTFFPSSVLEGEKKTFTKLCQCAGEVRRIKKGISVKVSQI